MSHKQAAFISIVDLSSNRAAGQLACSVALYLLLIPFALFPNMTFRHRDAFGRVSLVEGKDALCERFINPRDGRLARLVVQQAPGGSEDKDQEEEEEEGGIFYGNDGSNWGRIDLPERNVSRVMALVFWAYSSVLVDGSENRRWNGRSAMILAAKWVPSCILLTLMVS